MILPATFPQTYLLNSYHAVFLWSKDEGNPLPVELLKDTTFMAN